ncbi:MAG: Glyoxalase/bleomycin resistance protein/dioxygenase [Gemmatimonadetes bacterium]|nr:Glyoxalase/bleomycin resistance protein/dioxygenase [Gemmatimonadota bacterium]
MLSTADVIAFAATARHDEARAFYRDVLGLALVADDPFALVFDANGTMLRVAKVPAVHPAPYAILGWKVADIRAEVERLRGHGVAFNRYPGMEQDEAGLWTSPAGARIAWFHDPDGNVLSLAQL